MHKSALAAVMTLGFFARPEPNAVQSAPPLKEEHMLLQYTPAIDQAVVIVEAESETSLSRVEVRNPEGVAIIDLRASGIHATGLSGFTLETRECGLEAMLATCPAGPYRIRSRTEDGRPAVGGAILSHELLPAPRVSQPLDGAVDVPAAQLDIAWLPDPAAIGYTITLEQGENDGLTVKLPAGSGSFHVPSNVLAPGQPTHLEIGAIAPNGNRTLVEIDFQTS
jgi:hypothetical protein